MKKTFNVTENQAYITQATNIIRAQLGGTPESNPEAFEFYYKTIDVRTALRNAVDNVVYLTEEEYETAMRMVAIAKADREKDAIIAAQQAAYNAKKEREAHHQHLASTYDVSVGLVEMLSDNLGGNEDYDGLISDLDDFTDAQLFDDDDDDDDF